jgi:hypothetical protein
MASNRTITSGNQLVNSVPDAVVSGLPEIRGSDSIGLMLSSALPRFLNILTGDRAGIDARSQSEISGHLPASPDAIAAWWIPPKGTTQT